MGSTEAVHFAFSRFSVQHKTHRVCSEPRWHATWNLDDFSLAAGWEEGNSATWGPEMHAIVNGTDLPLGFEVSVPALCLAARSGRVETLELLLQRGGSELLRKVQTSAASTAVAAARSGHLRILSHLWEKGGCDPKKWFQMMPWAKLRTKP